MVVEKDGIGSWSEVDDTWELYRLAKHKGSQGGSRGDGRCNPLRTRPHR